MMKSNCYAESINHSDIIKNLINILHDTKKGFVSKKIMNNCVVDANKDPSEVNNNSCVIEKFVSDILTDVSSSTLSRKAIITTNSHHLWKKVRKMR